MVPDCAGGKLERLASNRDELKMILSSAGGQDRYLLAGRVEAADAQGLRPEPSEVFDFRKPPVLGGQFVVGNLSVTDFVVAVNLAGQIHDKVRNLLPGSPISQIKIG